LNGKDSHDDDAGDSISSYSWTAHTGVTLIDTSSAIPTFDYPSNEPIPDSLTFTLTVTDTFGEKSQPAQITVTLDKPPEVNAGANQIVKPLEHVTLHGSATDPEGESMTFAWDQLSGTPVQLTSEKNVLQPTFTAPAFDKNNDANNILRFQLGVDDGHGNVVVAVTTVNINHPPTANAGPNKIITRDDILSGKRSSVEFDGCASSDPDNDPLRYTWSLTKTNPDLNAPESPIPICNPPVSIGLTPADDDFGTKLTYKLVVNDGKIDSAPAFVDVTVCPRHDDITPAGKCNLPKIDVRAVKVSAPAPIYHLFIVYTDETGINYLFRGGPSSSFPHYGTIQGYNAVYAKGGPDWDLDAPSVSVMKGISASGKDSCFISELSRITSAKIQYHIGGPNSNTVVKTLLFKCKVPIAKPVLVAPGWDLPPL
jgi:hypothetical protein